MLIAHDCLFHIFSFVPEILDLYNVFTCCSYFNQGELKVFLKKKFMEKHAYITSHFPPMIIGLCGGIDQMIFYPIINNYTMILNKSPFFLEFTKHIQLHQMKYPIMIGRHYEKSFISFVVKSSKKTSFKGMVNECSNTEINYYVLSIYQRYCYHESSWYTTERNIFNSNLKYLVDHGSPIAGVKKGTFDILDDRFRVNLLRMLWSGTTTLIDEDPRFNIINHFTIDGVIPQRNNSLVVSRHYKI